MNKKRLLILAADKDAEIIIQTYIKRLEERYSNGSKLEITARSTGLGRDAGLRKDVVKYLSLYQKYDYAIVVFDYEGSGSDTASKSKSPTDLKREIEERVMDTGIKAENFLLIIANPEIEDFLWFKNEYVAQFLGWKNEGYDKLQEKIIANTDYWEQGSEKPHRPKEAIEYALRKNKMNRSPTIYKKIVEKVSLDRCKKRELSEIEEKISKWIQQ